MKRSLPYGLVYQPAFLSANDIEEIQKWLNTIHPIWESRYSKLKAPPPGREQRELLRPVYWLGAWQFACLNYYHPPKGVSDRCVLAEPFPPVLRKAIQEVEEVTRKHFRKEDIPSGWKLNTCLVNMYGSKIVGEKKIDCARVGEHKDYEPGPVASLSIGERALFQFVSGIQRLGNAEVISQMWLDHASLQIFGGDKWKNRLFHRVQRVDKRDEFYFPIQTLGFKTRRVNFTFRYVPEEHIQTFRKLSEEHQKDVEEYMIELAKHSSFFKDQI